MTSNFFQHPTSRRRFLMGSAGLMGFAGMSLVGCGGDDGSDDVSAATGASASGLEKTRLRVGYLPITDATPLVLAHGLDYYQEAGLTPEDPKLFRGWSQIAEAFQARQVDIVHLLMPMAVWLRFGQNFPLRLVAWNHTGGSALTVANDVTSVSELGGTTVAIPFWYSIHNVILQMLLRDAGLQAISKGNPGANEVKLVVMAPPDMPPALANDSIRGYIVADPFNAVAEVQGIGKILRFIPDVWFEHACCVALMHEEDVEKNPNWAQAVINSLAKAQLFARENRSEAARILSSEGKNFLPQPLPVIERALSHYDHDEYTATSAIQHADWATDRIDFQPFPYSSYTEQLIRHMKETVVEGDQGFLDSLDPAEAHNLLVADQFARQAIESVGGAEKFGIDPSLSRQERISV